MKQGYLISIPLLFLFLILSYSEAFGVGEVVRIIGDNLQICTASSCALSGPNTYGNLTIENRLGIGLGSPGTALDISVGSGEVGAQLSSALPGTRFRLGNTGANGKTYDLVVGSSGSPFGAGKFVISDRAGLGSDTDRIVVDTSGNVGIGTSTPATKLSVLNIPGYGNLEFHNDPSLGTYIQSYDRGTSTYKPLNVYAGSGTGSNYGRFLFTSSSSTIQYVQLINGSGTTLGFVYGDGGNFGLLNSAGSWIHRTPPNTQYALWSRELYPGNLNTATQGSYYLAGNYGGYGLYANTSLYSSSLYAPELYATNYFRPTGTGGMYWNAYGTRIYSNGANYINTGSNNGIVFYNRALTGTYGYVYTDGGNFGLLNNQGNWALWIPNNTQGFNTYGGVSTYGALGVGAFNNNDNNSDIWLNFSSNVPRIRVGGIGLGSGGPLRIRGSNGVTWMDIENSGNIRIAGATSYGVFTRYDCCYGDNWFRLVRNDARTTYSDLAVGPFYANGAVRFDLAEVTPVNPKEDLILGNLIAVDNGDTLRVTKTNGKYDDRLVGIVSHGRTASMTIGGDTGPEKVNTTKDRKPIALAGRVVTIVNLEGGAIKAGDSITSSSTPGVGMKASQAGTIVGRAMESYDGRSVNSKEVEKMVEKLREELKKEDPKTTQYADIEDAIRQLTQPLPKNTGRIISFIAIGTDDKDELDSLADNIQKQIDELMKKLP